MGIIVVFVEAMVWKRHKNGCRGDWHGNLYTCSRAAKATPVARESDVIVSDSEVVVVVQGRLLVAIALRHAGECETSQQRLCKDSIGKY